MSRNKLVIASWILSAASCVSSPAPSPGRIPTAAELALQSPPERCTVIGWEDGDTPAVRCGETEVVIRLLGVDTAESGFDANSRKRGEKQARLWGLRLHQVFACGKAATRRVRELCPAGSPVEVIGKQTGKYGRRLAYVICAGVDLNERLLAEGLAGRYPYPAPPEKPAACPSANESSAGAK